jgi:hypothetical protein
VLLPLQLNVTAWLPAPSLLTLIRHVPIAVLPHFSVIVQIVLPFVFAITFLLTILLLVTVNVSLIVLFFATLVEPLIVTFDAAVFVDDFVSSVIVDVVEVLAVVAVVAVWSRRGRPSASAT